MSYKLSGKVISHIYQDSDKEWHIQENADHCSGVANLASKFANKFNMSKWGYLAGAFHDLGKKSDAFQSYIRRNSGYDPSAPILPNHHHAYIGAVLAKAQLGPLSVIIENIIAGHHRGLYDQTDLIEIMKREVPEECLVSITDFKIDSDALNIPMKMQPQDVNHLLRMLYSCLVDADYLDTESFMNPEVSVQRSKSISLQRLLEKLDGYLADLSRTAPQTEVNRIRKEVQTLCRNNSHGVPGHYELSVPTGGGKTLASILWGLHHAIYNGLERVIIAIPYTSIIEQTATTLKNIFGEENVLEHHSQVDPDGISSEELRQQAKLAMENWDVPIIVTTNVRLFEAIFSHKPSACRRLHNIACSVVILDEIQTLPLHYYTPLLSAFDTYQRLFKVTWLYTTASQPLIYGTIRGTNPLNKAKALEKKPKPVVDVDASFWAPLRRVVISESLDAYSYQEIAEKLEKEDRVLCIVNTRKNAYEICSRMIGENTFLLSRLMCPAHIKSTLAEIQQRLKDPTAKVKVVSTQLVEAGVDIDFPVVYRQEAGLDSMIQAAGRCNREGKMYKPGVLNIFSLKEGGAMPAGFISSANQARLNMKQGLDPFGAEAMQEYFSQLTRRTESFDRDKTYELLGMNQLNFQTASEEFRLIKDDSVPVVVVWEDSEKWIKRYKIVGPKKDVMRALYQYTVSLPRFRARQLIEQGLIREEGMLYILSTPQCYDVRFGLLLDNDWVEEPMII